MTFVVRDPALSARHPILAWLVDANESVQRLEAHLSTGDSADGVFIKEDGVWKLAGINYSVDAYFNTTNSGSGFGATLFDAGELCYATSASWQYITDQAANIPTSFYSTRISAHADWIDSIVSPPVVENVPA